MGHSQVDLFLSLDESPIFEPVSRGSLPVDETSKASTEGKAKLKALLAAGAEKLRELTLACT